MATNSFAIGALVITKLVFSQSLRFSLAREATLTILLLFVKVKTRKKRKRIKGKSATIRNSNYAYALMYLIIQISAFNNGYYILTKAKKHKGNNSLSNNVVS